MFIAHLPAGYLAARAVAAGCKRYMPGFRWPVLLATALFFSVLPDFDLLWFYWVDNRQVLHHRYYTHLPVFWLVLLVPSLIFMLAARCWLLAVYTFTALFSVLTHQFLDTISGGIKWLWPMANDWTRWFTVPAIYDEWIVNFIFHWTFLLELGICLIAVFVWRQPMVASRKRNTRRQKAGRK